MADSSGVRNLLRTIIDYLTSTGEFSPRVRRQPTAADFYAGQNR